MTDPLTSVSSGLAMLTLNRPETLHVFTPSTVIPGLAKREPGTQGIVERSVCPRVPDRAPRVRNDGVIL